MFTCKYCSSEFTEHKSNCPNCGAPIKVADKKVTQENAPKSIREVCIKYEGVRSLHLDEAIDTKRLKIVRENFNIPANEKIIMVYDDTIFGSNKVGFAICAGGLFWKNDWSVETKRTFLSWDDFSERKVELDHLHIKLGRGDAIGTAGIGDEEARKQIVEMLVEIKKLLV
jgi:hypothetical protein